jgi:tetratricopeptide (TPR) repeat protein
MKSCYVIMPYGGDSEASRRHFSGVFEGIIAPAARNAGYSVKRSDIAGEPGSITNDIIRDLAEADIVIADLTLGNANVFFELGIRHAFRKSGTVHIIDATHKLPFDVRQYRVIEYSTELADVPDVMAKIEDAIQKRAAQPDRADNPVHDAIPALPVDIRAIGSESLLNQLKASEEALQRVRLENDRLSDNLKQLDPTHHALEYKEDVDIDALLDVADKIMQFTGQHAILRLRDSMERGGVDAFVKELRSVLKSPYVDPNDFAEIVLLCQEANLDEHRRATLQIAVKRHPHSHEMLLAYVDALDDSPNPMDRERARIMIEKDVGIQFNGESPRLAGSTNNLPSMAALGILFNTYFRAQKQTWVLSVVDSLPESFQSDSMILRSKARALSELHRDDEAEESYRKAITLDPSDDQIFSNYAHFLSERHRYKEAYENYETAISADPEDAKLLIVMAIEIFNNGYYRSGSGEISGPIVRKERTRLAVPFILRAIEISPNPGTIDEAVKVLVRANAMAEAHAIASGGTLPGVYDPVSLRFVLGLETPESSEEQ